ncbi:MAG: hypothetical protein FWC47_13670 [Oscillospiraceae bacterium]|nr:hypothetical protein [Oscillospiraceae bacterium]
MKISSLFILVLSFFLLFGCSKEVQKDELRNFVIENWSTSIGAIDENNLNNTDEQKYSYTLYLTSETGMLDDVKEVRPIFGDNIKNKIITNDLPIIKSADTSIEVQGYIIFDAKGLTKVEIAALTPFFTEVQIITKDNSEYIVKLNILKLE